jgi:hypothetical protein
LNQVNLLHYFWAQVYARVISNVHSVMYFTPQNRSSSYLRPAAFFFSSMHAIPKWLQFAQGAPWGTMLHLTFLARQAVHALGALFPFL